MGGIFICYRRGDTGPYAGRLRDALSQHFGTEQVFRDIDSVDLGERFPRVIEREVGSCDALLALIGPMWMSIKDDAGGRRLDDPNDYVHLEIATVLRREDDVLVIPVLVGPTSMPAAAYLPGPLASLAECNALRITDENWDDQLKRLTGRLAKVVEPRVMAPLPSHHAPTPPPPERSRHQVAAMAMWGTIAAAGISGISAIVVGVLNHGDDASSSGPTTTTTETTTTLGATGWPTDVTPQPSASKLMALLPAGYDGAACEAVHPPATGALATVDCGTVSTPGGPANARYSLFADQQTLDSQFDVAVKDNSLLLGCPNSGDSPTTWHYSETPDRVGGRIACGADNLGAALVWTKNSDLLLADAHGLSMDDLHRWWLETTADAPGR
jgi:hypothetical protein